MQLHERLLENDYVPKPTRREVYELVHQAYIQIQSDRSANPYWQVKDVYELQDGDKVLQEAGVYVVGVGWFEDRDAFVEMMKHSFRAVIIE